MSNLTYDGTHVWANIDKPVKDRAPERFFRAIKKHIVAWGDMDKRNIRFEVDCPSKKLIIKNMKIKAN